MSRNSKRPPAAPNAEPPPVDDRRLRDPLDWESYLEPRTPPGGDGEDDTPMKEFTGWPGLPEPDPPLDPGFGFTDSEGRPPPSHGDPDPPADSAGPANDLPAIQSGFFFPNGRPVPPTHPDHGPMHLLPRRADGGFAAYYYCSKAELEEWGLHNPPPLRHRHDGFTPERIAIFIRTLRATATVSDACRAAGITRKTAYDLYNREDAAHFRRMWDEALRGPNIVLTSTAYERAINGVEEAVWYKGEFRGWRVRQDNRLLMWLLRVRDPLNFAPLDDLQGWLRHRDVEPHRPLEPGLDRLRAAEEEWGRRLPDPPDQARLSHESPLPIGEREGAAQRREGEGRPEHAALRREGEGRPEHAAPRREGEGKAEPEAGNDNAQPPPHLPTDPHGKDDTPSC